MSNEKMTRKTFIKSFGIGILSLFFTIRSIGKPDIVKANVSDNLSPGGVSYGPDAPAANPNTLWIDPNENDAGKYCNGTKWLQFTSRSYVKSQTAPSNKSTIWLNVNDGAFYYYDGNSWVPVTALWG